MHYTTIAGCTANISVNRNRIKQYNNAVFLKDGQSFEIELFNPRNTPVLAKISINGEYISEAGVVVKPGQRVYLERFLDEPKKFKFETYAVEDTDEAKSAIQKNGEVKVSFFYESDTRAYTYINAGAYVWNPPNVTTNNAVWTTNTLNPSAFGITTNSSAPYGGTTVNYCSTHAAGSLETGRVEQGGKSDQTFTNYGGKFNWVANETVIIKLKPLSAKPVESGEIRNYCSGCGTRIKKSSWNFCPSCGTGLE